MDEEEFDFQQWAVDYLAVGKVVNLYSFLNLTLNRLTTTLILLLLQIVWS